MNEKIRKNRVYFRQQIRLIPKSTGLESLVRQTFCRRKNSVRHIFVNVIANAKKFHRHRQREEHKAAIWKCFDSTPYLHVPQGDGKINHFCLLNCDNFNITTRHEREISFAF
jgi:hypothetical protein